MRTLLTFAVTFSLACPSTVSAQMPNDGFMMKPGVLCIDVTYEHSRWNEYWEGTLKRDNENVGTLRRHTLSPMFNLGIVKWLNAMASVHYVITEPTAGQIEGAKGFSDFNFWLKAEAWRKKLGPGTFNILATAGLMVPMSDYVPDYPYAIGLGCIEGNFKGILQYRFDKGFFVRAHTGYMIRGNSKLQRDYYFTTEGYYSDECEMPNALDYSGAVGYYLPDKQIRAEIIVDGMHTFGGFDMRRQDMPFPSNKMEFTRMGAGVHYYPSFAPGLDIHAAGGYTLTGRNVGQAAVMNFGLSYVFQTWKREKKTEDKPAYERPMN
ncbi:MAG: transporter [Chitinophagales bacterium]|nr:transporter [Chitinophagales bacterium]